MLKRKLRLFAVILLSLALTAPMAVLAESPTQVSISLVTVDAGSGIYKLVFSVRAAGNLKLFNTVLSYDNTVIMPVKVAALPELVMLPDDELRDKEPFKVVAFDSLNDYLVDFLFGWRTQGDRTAFEYGVISLEGEIASAGEEIALFEFYFRDIKKATPEEIAAAFTLEDGSGSDELLSTLHPQGKHTGLQMRIEDGHINAWGGSLPETETEDFDLVTLIGRIITRSPSKMCIKVR